MRICALPHRIWSPRVKLSATLSVGRDAVDLPRKWREPAHVFVVPHKDLFELPAEVVSGIFVVMNGTARHEFQVTTRHPERALEMRGLEWTPNIWLGATITGEESASRIDALQRVPAHVHFAHLRPEERLPALDLQGLDFVIVEAEGEPAGLDALEARCLASGLRLFVGPRAHDAETRVDSDSALMRRGANLPRRP